MKTAGRLTVVVGVAVTAMWLYYRWGTRDEPVAIASARREPETKEEA